MYKQEIKYANSFFNLWNCETTVKNMPHYKLYMMNYNTTYETFYDNTGFVFCSL
jgi:hypothetical protein